MPKDEFTSSALMKMKKDELLVLAKARKIKIDGNLTKSEIIERLMQNVDHKSQKTVPDTSGTKSSAGEKPKTSPRPKTKPADAKVVDQADAKVETPETVIEKSKYEVSKPQDHVPPYLNKDSFYFHSEENHLVLLVQNPYWCFAYWSVSEKSREDARHFYGKLFSQAELTLRIYNETIIQKEDRIVYFDIPVRDDATSWYINIPRPENTYYAEIGFKVQHRFFILCQSNYVNIPGVTLSKTSLDFIQSPKEIIDRAVFYPQAPQSVSTETAQQILNVMGGGASINGPSSADSHAQYIPSVSSWNPASLSSGEYLSGQKTGIDRDFWYSLECEVIISGQVQPGGKVIINDTQEISLDENHRFRFQFALADGMVELKTMGISSDGKISKTIRPIISKKTDIF